MLFFTIVSTFTIGLSAVLAVSGQDVIPNRTCGSSLGAEAIVEAEAHFKANTISAEFKNSGSGKAVLNVHWHVISADKTLKNGYVPDSQIKKNIEATNRHLAKTGVSLKLVSIDRTINKPWFASAGPETPKQAAMKKALRRGGPADVNVYTVGFKEGEAKGLLGYATFPKLYEGAEQDDGIVILYSTLPGGSLKGYNEGKTFTHELGHWLGLYHTFQGESCTGGGDFVSDTPPEKAPASGCPIGRNTCPGGGKDPIHNFMDYSQDSCLNEFTPGQVQRLKSQIRLYRGVQI